MSGATAGTPFACSRRRVSLQFDGMKAPAPKNSFITKDEMGDYLEAYARHFELPVRTGFRVDRLAREDGRFVIQSGGRCLTADNVIVAMGNHQCPKVPGFATELDPAIRQLHSIEYRNPDQLQDGDVLIVGAGNSGAEIARDVAGERRIWLAGRDVGQIPFTIDSTLGRALVRPVLRGLFHRVLTIRTPMGRRMRPKVLAHGGPLIRVKNKQLSALGVERVGRVTGVKDGKPMLDDGHVLDVANVLWCTGFHPASPGSTSMSSASTNRTTVAASSKANPASTSSASNSSTRSAPNDPGCRCAAR